VSVSVHQQINLYQPIFRQARKLFSAQTVAWGLLLVLATLSGLWGFAAVKVAGLESELHAVREQQHAQERLAAATGALRAERANPTEVRARIEQLSVQLAERSHARDLLRSGAAGRTTGFAARLEALARQHMDGLWLERIVLSGATNTMSLSGGTLNPALVPRYLQALSKAPALNGARFDEFVIERPQADEPNAHGVRFRAGSAALTDAATEREPS
jgi:hypothetical protein